MHLLLLKSRTFALSNQSAKGLSLALRAAKLAESTHLHALLLHALTALSHLLLSSGDFNAAQKLAEAGLAKAFESGDLEVMARLLSLSGQAGVGVAGALGAGRERVALLRRAEGSLERSREGYGRLEALGEVEALHFMKARVARFLGEGERAEREESMRAQVIAEMEGGVEGFVGKRGRRGSNQRGL